MDHEEGFFIGKDVSAYLFAKFLRVAEGIEVIVLNLESNAQVLPEFVEMLLVALSGPAEDGAQLQAGGQQRVLLGRPLALNSWQPALLEWLAGRAAWPGVDWSTTAMRGVIGLVDDPYNARQLPLVVDFSKGHAVLFGASGWGKTTFFRSLVASLAATHSPGEFQAHILDLGGRSLEVLGVLPHVGSVIMPDERGYEERVQQLLSELENIVDERKRQFSSVGVSTLFEYNVQAGVPVEPAMQAQALQAGAVDMMFTGDPMATAMLQRGLAEVVDDGPPCARRIADPFSFGTVAYSGAFARRSPAVARRMAEALDEAIALTRRDPAGARAAMQRYLRADERPYVAHYPDSRYATSREFQGLAAELARARALGILDRDAQVQPL